MSKEVMKLALEALEIKHSPIYGTSQTARAITAIKEALAQPERDYERGFIDGMQKQMQSSVDKAVNRMAQPEQEPVAWGVFDHNLHDMFFTKEEAQEMVRLKGDGSTVKPLYTAPPQRTWVGLTDEEINGIAKNYALNNPTTPLHFARAIEAAQITQGDDIAFAAAWTKVKKVNV